MKNLMQYGVVLVSILSIPGCGRLADWGKDMFYQGHQLNNSAQVVQRYIRSVRIYDQFSTCAIFDAIWLADQVREVYAAINSERFGKQEDHAKAFLRRQLEENSHFISFYVLSLYEVALGSQDSEWSIFLRINGINIFPREIKSIELPHEYQYFFGKKYTRFKVPYIITFDAKDLNENYLIRPENKEVMLCFRSSYKEGTMVWKIDIQGHSIPTIPGYRQYEQYVHDAPVCTVVE